MSRIGSTRYEVRFDATGLDIPGIEVLVVSEPNAWSLDAGNRLARQGDAFVGTAWLDQGHHFSAVVVGLTHEEALRVVAERRLAGKMTPAEPFVYNRGPRTLFLTVTGDDRYPVDHTFGYPANFVGETAVAI